MKPIYNIEKCAMCGKEPHMYYDNENYDALYNIKCCVFYIRTYRTIAFKEWNELMINYKKEQTGIEVPHSITCDKCNTTYTDGMEIQEFIHVRDVGGYGSVFGDCEPSSYDICQHCFYRFIND